MSETDHKHPAHKRPADRQLQLDPSCHLVVTSAGLDALEASLHEPPRRVEELAELFALDRIPSS